MKAYGKVEVLCHSCITTALDMGRDSCTCWMGDLLGFRPLPTTFENTIVLSVGRRNSVDIATGYGMDGQASESRRFKWPSGLRRGTASDRLLGLRVWIPSGACVFLLCVVSEDKKTKCRTIKTKNQVRMKYRVQKNTKEIPVGARFSAPVQTCPGAHSAPSAMSTGSFSRG